MLIQGTSVTVTYEKIEGIKKVYYNNEDILKEYFNEATALPVPDDAPVEIPRIIIRTLHEHAQLSITPVAATFEIRYNDGFEKDWAACSEYITMRMKKIFEFLNLLTENRYGYIGLVSTLIYDEVQKNGVEKISQVLLNSQKIKGIHDINIKYTFIEEENIFVNIMLQNARLFQNGTEENQAGSLNEKNQVAESIGAVIDINDRYGFNSIEGYHSDNSMLEKLLQLMTEVINNKLSSLIEKGEY